jgi:hypothetical protein
MEPSFRVTSRSIAAAGATAVGLDATTASGPQTSSARELPVAAESPVAAQPERTRAAIANVATAAAVFPVRGENENELIFLLYIMGFEPVPKNMVQVPKYRLAKFRKP